MFYFDDQLTEIVRARIGLNVGIYLTQKTVQTVKKVRSLRTFHSMVKHPAGVWEQGIVCNVMFNFELCVICSFNVRNRLIDCMLIVMLIGLWSGFKIVTATTLWSKDEFL